MGVSSKYVGGRVFQTPCLKGQKGDKMTHLDSGKELHTAGVRRPRGAKAEMSLETQAGARPCWAL